MFCSPPDISRNGFLRVLDEAVSRLDSGPPLLCGSLKMGHRRRTDPPEKIWPMSRLSVILEGADRHALNIDGKRQEATLLPGQCIYFTPNAWSIPFFDRASEFLGVVFRPDHIRLIQVVLNGAFPTENETPWAYHTAQPLDQPGTQIVSALDYMAEHEICSAGARELIVALLKQVREQLVDDSSTGRPTHIRSTATWSAVQAYIRENYSGELSRKSVARALGLHPNYISNLAQRLTGHSFRQELEQIRMGHARQLLHDSKVPVAQIGKLCGYADSDRFSKVFRRANGLTPTQFRELRVAARPLQKLPPLA